MRQTLQPSNAEEETPEAIFRDNHSPMGIKTLDRSLKSQEKATNHAIHLLNALEGNHGIETSPKEVISEQDTASHNTRSNRTVTSQNTLDAKIAGAS